MKTYKECKDEVLEVEIGLTWDDWMLHHELPKGDLVDEYEQRAADMYANQFNIKKPNGGILDQRVFDLLEAEYMALLSFYAENVKEVTPDPTEV